MLFRNVCQAANTPEFKKSELECLHEYVSVMQPVAAALDKLHGEKAAYFGNILPTLHMLQTTAGYAAQYAETL